MARRSFPARFFVPDVRARLMLLVILAVVPAFGLMIHMVHEQRRLAAEQIEAESLRLAHLAVAEQERAIEGVRQLLVALAQQPEIREGRPAAVRDFLDQLVRQFPQYDNFAVLGPAGELLASGVPAPGDVVLSDRAYFRRVIRTRGFSVGDYQIGRVTRRPTLNFAFPVLTREGEVSCVIVAAMNLGWIGRMLGQTRLPEGAAVTLMDGQGTVLARHPDNGRWVGRSLPESDLVRTILTRHEGQTYLRGLDGVRRLYAFTPLEGTGRTRLYLALGLSSQAQFAGADRIYARSLAGLAGAGLLALAAAWLLGTALIVRHTRPLVSAARRLRTGARGVRTGLAHGEDELSQVAEAFDEMAAELDQREAERLADEQALRESEERYRKLVEASPEALWINSGGRVAFINPAAVAMFGASSAAELIGRPVLDLVHPDCHERTRKRLEGLAAGKPAPWLEQTLVRLDGRTVVAEVAAVPFTYEGGPAVQVIARDLTERKRLEANYLQAQKMEAVGRLAGGVAHDFNNILTAIMGYSTFLQTKLGPDHPSYRDAVGIHHAGTRAAALTRQLLAFSRQQVVEPKILDLNRSIQDLGKLLRRLIGEDVELVMLPGTALGHVRADPGQVDQMIMNLVVNARDAMPGGGTITVETANTDLDCDSAARDGGARPGRYVMLAVADTGCGMDAETRERLFEPFFTTKECGKGTGLGLATVYGIVEKAGGHIEVCSEMGKGATFRIYLPRVDGAVETPAVPATQSEPGQRSGTVLLVEDEELVRGVVREALRRHGYDVLEAGSPDEAVRLFDRDGSRIDLLVTDVVMPGRSGPELVQELRSRGGSFKILYMSGYTAGNVVRHGALDASAAFLQKPFTPDALAAKLLELRGDEPARRAA